MDDNIINEVRPNSRFSNYDPQTSEQRAALEIVRAMAGSIIENAENLAAGRASFTDGALWVLSGGPGVGKTHLIEAFINEIREKTPALSSLESLRD
ncbi:MAG: hypothetical protein P4M13_01760 [Alphaproteobacteria bacterium]|nr:hypothetical protein [Alphaproteobacteria bacterium]